MNSEAKGEKGGEKTRGTSGAEIPDVLRHLTDSMYFGILYPVFTAGVIEIAPTSLKDNP